MAKPKKRYCCLCKDELPRREWGFNPEPVAPYSSGTCCVRCYRDKVLPKRNKGLQVIHGNTIIPPKMDKVDVKEI